MTDKSVLIEGARIMFRNFAGKQTQYNAEGKRNFCVVLPPDIADQMARDGWNVKALKPREQDDEPTPYIQVSVSFKNRPPKVALVTSKGKRFLEEEMVELVDWIDIQHVDLIINPYDWDVNGKTGTKAYLKTIVVIVKEDYLELKYADVQEIDGPITQAIDAGQDWVEGEVISEDWHPRRAISA